MITIGEDTTIFIDFDDTLFDYSRALNWILKELTAYGLSKLDWDDTYKDIKEKFGIYNRGEHFKLLSKRAGTNIDAKGIWQKLRANAGTGIFKDALDFIHRYKDNQLYIVSYGETKYQMEKILSSGITEYFTDIIVTSGSKADIVAKIPYTKAIFIDDKAEHLQAVYAKCKDIDTILIDRLGRHAKDKVRVYSIINDLSEL